MRMVLLMAVLMCLWGCARPPSGAHPVSLEFRLAQFEPAEGLTEQTVQGSDRKVYIQDEAVLSNADVASATVLSDPEKQLVILLKFTASGAKRFSQATAEHVMKPIAILVDGNVVSAPVVREKISGGKAQISGSFTEDEAMRIAEGIVPR